MPTPKLSIIPVTLDPIDDTVPFVVPSAPSHSATSMIKAADIEISFFNGVDDRIIQVIMKELRNR